jgi:prophage DNA circulation protein
LALTAQSGLPTTKFGTNEFPCETHAVDGDGRHHVHEYGHTPGGYVEKLGRSLYSVTVRGNFQATFPAFPGLYPDTMNALRADFEQQTTKTFVHPTMGSFPAFIIKWHQVKDARMLSGEKVDITFLEDQSASFTIDAYADASGETNGPDPETAAAQFNAIVQQVKDELAISPNEVSLFDGIQQLAEEIGAVQDTVSLIGNNVGAKLQALAGLCASVEASFSMQDVRAWPIVDSCLTLWQSCNLALQDIQSKRVQLRQYVVPKTQTIIDCAIDIYNDASRSSDLLSLNPLVADTLSIQAATVLQYYPD